MVRQFSYGWILLAQKGISEFDAKTMLSANLPIYSDSGVRFEFRGFAVDRNTDFRPVEKKHRWLKMERLVVKLDQLVGKRGKHGLVHIAKDWNDAKRWVKGKLGKTVEISEKKGVMETFIVEPFFRHDREFYLAFRTEQYNDAIIFSEKGGIDVEENWHLTRELKIPVLEELDRKRLESFLGNIPNKNDLAKFTAAMFQLFRNLNFSYLEINPLGFDGKNFSILDTVARLDDTAAFESGRLWGGISFPDSFGAIKSLPEKTVEELDSRTGASLKLKILNPDGKIWLMVAGGGASVIFADTVSDLGMGKELSNYGEYSGDPSMEFTYQYALVVIESMLKSRAKGKLLLIGGGIANFTDVAETFRGIIKAIREKSREIRKQKIRIYVRRGGPNFEEGLRNMERLSIETGIPITVLTPKSVMTKIVELAVRGGKK